MECPTPRDDSPDQRSCVKRYLVEHFDELHEIAARQMAGENAGHSMQATALMNEAVCQLLSPARSQTFKNANHFLATANVMMQHILIDRSRRKNSQKAGGRMNRLLLDENLADSNDQFVELLMLQEELNLLQQHDPLAAQVIQKRCEGYSIDEVAQQLGITRTNAYDLWKVGRAWLLQMFHQVSSSG